MSTSLFVLVDGVQGESTDKDHHGWIEAISFTHSIAVPIITSGGGGGSSTGRAQESFAFSKPLDSTSPGLYGFCATGKHIKSVTLDFVRSVENVQVKYLSAKLEDVVLSGVTSTGDLQGPPTDRVSLIYGKITWTGTQTAFAAGGLTWTTTALAELRDVKIAQ